MDRNIFFLCEWCLCVDFLCYGFFVFSGDVDVIVFVIGICIWFNLLLLNIIEVWRLWIVDN